MFIPTKEHFCDMTPEEFEKYSLKLLKEQTQGLENLEMFEKNNVEYKILENGELIEIG